MQMRKWILLGILILIAGLTSCIKANAQGPTETYTVLEMDILEVADEFDLSPHLLASLLYEESRFVAQDNISQITNKKWFAEGIEYTGSDDLSDRHNNIRICGYYMHKWAEMFPEEPHLWVRMWNMGFENALADPDATSAYSRRILARAEEWEEQYPVKNYGKE